MLYQILVTIPEACRRPKDSKNMNLRQSLEEDLFTVYVARIPIAGEILKVTRESCGKSFTYAYKVLDVDITCYLKPKDRKEYAALDAGVTGLLTDSSTSGYIPAFKI